MLEHGNPNPYASDINGITPLHVACAKLDWETFEDLIKIGGDPLLPDHDGNTFLHLLCEGGIKDVEYDFDYYYRELPPTPYPMCEIPGITQSMCIPKVDLKD